MHTSGGDRPFLELLDHRDLDLGLGYTAYCRVAVIGRYLHTRFHSNQKNFLWTDVRTLRHYFIRWKGVKL